MIGAAGGGENHHQVEGEGEEEEDYDEDEAGFESCVQLGFLEPIEKGNPEDESCGGYYNLHSNLDWSEWDGGKVGGRPSWLNPRGLPEPGMLACPEEGCGRQLSFLLQIYCPLDDPPEAFHRTLYLFYCLRGGCNFGLALRCQLPRENPFYPPESLTHDEYVESGSPPKNDPAVWDIQLCALCGCAARSSCGQCKKVYYCSRHHQKAHWKRHRHNCQSHQGQQEEAACAPVEGATLSEFEIVVLEEKSVLLEEKEEEKKLLDKHTAWLAAENGGEEEEECDGGLSQSELDEAAGVKEKDPATVQFLLRSSGEGRRARQVLRYSRWGENGGGGGGPLWCSSVGVPLGHGDVPPCASCGAPRAFEFQVMPQLLHFIREETTGCFDWGVIAVYTCTGSCSLSPYSQEFVWRQPPLDFEGSEKDGPG